MEDKKWGYYSLFSTELAYNGNLQGQSKIYINKFEIIDFYNVIKTYFDKGIFNLDYIIQEYIKNCKEKTVYYGI